MYKKDSLIEQGGFINVIENGKKIGFRFRLRKPGAKVIYLSLLASLKVTVDGEEFGESALSFSVDDKVFYTLAEMEDMTTTEWDNLGTVLVRKENGLACGLHNLSVTFKLWDVMPTVYRTWGSATYTAENQLTITEKSEMEKSGRIELSVSMFSYCVDVQNRQMDLRQYVQTVAETQARGLEIIPEVTFPGFPALANSFVTDWHDWTSYCGVEPVCLAAHNTINPRGRDFMSQEEGIEVLRDLIRYAKRMGFSMIRTNDTSPEILEAVIPMAEEYDVKLGFEIHPPISLNSEIIERNLNVMKKTGTKHFGFIPDLGIFMVKPPEIMRENMIRQGARREIIEWICDCYVKKVGKNQVLDELEAQNATGYEIACLNKIYNNNSENPEDLKKILPHIVEVHAKFFEVNDDFEEESIDFVNTISLLLESGYSGYICAEYEGHWYQEDIMRTVPAVEQVRRLFHMLRTKFDS